MLAGLWSLAAAAATVELVEPVPWVLHPDEHDAILEDLVGRTPADARRLTVLARGPDGRLRPLSDYLAPVPPVPDKGEVRVPREAPVDLPGEATGALSGKAIYLSQCHGWHYYESLDAFSTQRPNLYDTVEDFHNPEAANQYLARYLENAGARVFTTKERDLNPNMAIADDDGDGYAETGSGFEDGPAGFAEQATWDYGEDPFDHGGTRRFPAAGGGQATWIPEVPAPGLYAVYVSWDSDSANAPDAHYRITHPAGVIERTYDQTVHGSTWQYVETLWLPAGVDGLTVELLGDSSCGDCWLSADAVRVGGGMGDVMRLGDRTDRPRWEEAAVLYTQWNGAPTSVYDPYEDGIGSDPSSRSRWAAWEHPAGEDAVYLSWHTNAGGGTGTSTYTYDGSSYDKVDGSDELGELVHEEIIAAIETFWDADWTDRGTREDAFSELSPGHNDEMPAVLVELAFHDDEYDVELIKDPRFRRDAARAMARGVVRYFAERDGETPHFQPEPPVDLALAHGSEGQLVASWAPGPSGEPYGDAADSYVIYTSDDGRSWDGGTETADTAITVSVSAGRTVFVRVAARNAGGLSFPSEPVGARRSPYGSAPVLVVGAFDRLQVSLLPWESIGGEVGDVVRMHLPRVNPFDVAASTGRAIAEAGWYFDTVSDEVFDSLDLSPYGLVVWVAGEESTADESLSDSQQEKVRAFVEGGGALWVSGAEVLWDLDYRGSAGDQAFCDEVLGARMASDDSETTAVDGAGILEGLDLDFGEDPWVIGGGAPYPVEYPDVLDSDREVLATYAGGGTAAVVGDGVALMGFPFECIADDAVRAEVAARLLPVLLPDYDPPEPEDTGDTGVVVDDDDTGAPDGDGVAPPGRLVPPPKGCGCQASGGAGLFWLGLLALARRRPVQRTSARVAAMSS